MKYLLSCVLILLFSIQIAFAQVNSNAFNIRIFGADTTPPTTPTLLSALPIAETQINLNWTASTDDYAVAGYSVLRNSTPIATTTSLSYADTGLAASTTYSYSVRAFDAALNYSSTSNSLATTTLQIPVIPPVSTSTVEASSQGTVARIVIDELRVEEGISTTSIFLHTTHPSRIEVRWGKTASYELGYIVSDAYSNEHTILLTDLEPGTKYEYQIIGFTPRGAQSVIHTGSFITKSKSLPVSPVNVSRFQAVRNGNNVDLSWQLPSEKNISYVRIVRSHLGFPGHPQNGAIVYQGQSSNVSDVGILNQYSPVYYTAFVYDTFGNVSSGAIAIVYALTNQEPGEIYRDNNTGPVPNIVEEATSSVNVERVTVDMKMPQASEIMIIQEGIKYSLFDTDIILDSEHSFTLSIPRSAITGNLKSIIATFLEPTDNRKTHSFLLRINQDQTAYEATIAPLGVVGRSQVTVEIFDYEAFVVATYKAPLNFTNLLVDNDEEVLFPDIFYKRPEILLLVIALLITLLLVFLLMYKRQGEDNE